MFVEIPLLLRPWKSEGTMVLISQKEHGTTYSDLDFPNTCPKTKSRIIQSQRLSLLGLNGTCFCFIFLFLVNCLFFYTQLFFSTKKASNVNRFNYQCFYNCATENFKFLLYLNHRVQFFLISSSSSLHLSA